jgi:hypothetical protein
MHEQHRMELAEIVHGDNAEGQSVAGDDAEAALERD